MDLKKLLENLKKGNTSSQMSNIIIIILVGVLILIAASFFKNDNTVSSLTSKVINNSSPKNTANDNANSTSTSNMSSTEEAYENQQETKLKNLLQTIEGVGNVQVIIYYDSDGEEVPAYNENVTSSVVNETDNSGGKRSTIQNSASNTVVTVNDGDKNKPLIVKNYKPKVTGVLISAQGAENSDVKYSITRSVSSLFNISENEVEVNPMKK